MSDRIFSGDWRDCLREHYKHVIRQQDKLTEKSLASVLVNELGFCEDELFALRVEAERTESMPGDYVPEEVIQQARAESAAETDPELFEDEVSPQAEVFPEPEAELDTDREAADGPRQLSLF